ncbi:MAG: glycosyltransferase family 39 protein [SAR324 cluster bacterium]|nr:glycosyltransferase family 39 protein [SAR324 cluster bacterium]
MTVSPQSLKHLPFLFLLILTTGLYFAILWTSQSHVDGDEGVVGIMAKHIIDQDANPVFFYGQAYGGGGAIEAYLAVIPFLLFGISSISLKLVALVFAILTLLLTYCFCLKHFDLTTALFSSTILAATTALIEWHFKVRGGYILLPFLSLLILWIFVEIAYEKKCKKVYFFLLGFCSGFAYYNMELIIPLLITIFTASFYWKKIFWKKQALVPMLAGVLVGVFPLLHFNLSHQFANFKSLFQQTEGRLFTRAIENFIPLFTEYLPGFFSSQNSEFVGTVGLTAYLEYLAFAFLIIWVFVFHFSSLIELFKGFLKAKHPESPPPLIVLFLLYLLIHLLINLVTKDTGRSLRYFVSLFPMLAVLAGHTNAILIKKFQGPLKFFAAAPLLLIAGLGWSNHFHSIHASMVSDDVWKDGKRVETVLTSGETVPAIIAYLKKEKIKTFRSTYFLQWRILFESQEELIGSSYGLVPRSVRYPAYDQRVFDAERIAFILHQEDFQLKLFQASSKLKYFGPPHQVGEYLIYIGQQPQSFKIQMDANNRSFDLKFFDLRVKQGQLIDLEKERQNE